MKITKPRYTLLLASLLAAPAIVGLASPSVSAEGQVLTVAKDGTGMYSTIQEAADAAVPGDTVEIAGGTYQEAVRPARSGTAEAWITYKSKPGESVVIDGNKVHRNDNGLINLDSRSYLKLSGLTVDRSPTHGLYGYLATNIVLENSKVSNSSNGGAVFIAGANITVQSNDIHNNNDIGTSASHEAVSLDNVDGFEVKNNHVHDNGEEGIDAKYEARNGTIHHNTVVNNRGPNIYIDSSNNIKVYNNTAKGAYGSTKPGILLAVEDYSTTKRLFQIDVFNNISTDNVGGGIAIWKESKGTISDIRVVNNVAYNNQKGGFVFSTNGFSGANVLRNNILTGNQQNIFMKSKAGRTFEIDNNLLTGDPKYVDAAAGDFRLLDGSPAIDEGSSVLAPTFDFSDAPRPQGLGYDMGAYER